MIPYRESRLLCPAALSSVSRLLIGQGAARVHYLTNEIAHTTRQRLRHRNRLARRPNDVYMQLERLGAGERQGEKKIARG